MIAAGAIPAADIRVGSQQALAVYAGEELVWKADLPCVTFASESAISLRVGDRTKHWDGAIEYSTDGLTWTLWDGTTEITSGQDHKIHLRGTGNTVISPGRYDYRFVLTGSEISCSGNIEALLDYQSVMLGQHPTVGEAAFYSLFSGNDGLINLPDLSTVVLSNGCFAEFASFSGVRVLPKLSQLVFPSTCFNLCFWGCSNIKMATTQSADYPNAYRIPETGTASAGYSAFGQMFSGSGGSFKGTPAVNSTYYTSNSVE